MTDFDESKTEPSFEISIPEGAAPLESILCTDEARKPVRVHPTGRISRKPLVHESMF